MTELLNGEPTPSAVCCKVRLPAWSSGILHPRVVFYLYRHTLIYDAVEISGKASEPSSCCRVPASEMRLWRIRSHEKQEGDTL